MEQDLGTTIGFPDTDATKVCPKRAHTSVRSSPFPSTRVDPQDPVDR